MARREVVEGDYRQRRYLGIHWVTLRVRGK